VNQEQSKKILPELIITAAVLYGLWSLVVSPLRESLSQAQAAHANMIEQTRIAGDPKLSTPRLQMVMDAIDGAINDIERRSVVARDQTTLQARLMEIGADAGIRIDRVSPAQTRSIKAGDYDDRVVSFEIDCSGQYRDIADFLARVEESIGLTRIDRISIRPDTTGSGAAVRAKLRTMHFSFDTSPPPPSDDAVVTVGGGH